VCSEADVKTLQLQLGLPSSGSNQEEKDSDKSSLATSSKFQLVIVYIVLYCGLRCELLHFTSQCMVWLGQRTVEEFKRKKIDIISCCHCLHYTIVN